MLSKQNLFPQIIALAGSFSEPKYATQGGRKHGGPLRTLLVHMQLSVPLT